MAKNAVTDWDTVAANNTDIGGIGIQGTNTISNFDNALRTVMSQIATFNTGATYTGSFTVTSTDAGAGNAPIVAIYRNSASPAASDLLGRLSFTGNDSGGNETTYADIYARIDDTTNGSEDSSIFIRNIVAGTNTIQALVTSTGWNSMNIGATTPGSGAFTTLTASGAVTFTSGSITGITDLAVADGGTGASTAAAARTNLGLVIGTNVQAWDADLDTWATKTAPSGVVVGTTDSQTLTNKTLTGAILNGTIGATTPATGAFTTLTASGDVTFTSTDAGAGNAPIVAIYRNSASPAASDLLGRLSFTGNDSGGNETTYADMYVRIDDATNGSEDSSIFIRNIVAGTNTIQALVTSTGWNSMDIGATTRGTGAFTTLAANSTVTFTNGGSMTGTWSNLGTVTTIDINGGTVDGAVIGGASAAAITGTTVTASTAFRAADGSAGTPSVSFTNDTNTGIYSGAADALSFATGGAYIGQFSTSGFMVGVTAMINVANAEYGFSTTDAGVATVSTNGANSALRVKRNSTGSVIQVYNGTTFCGGGTSTGASTMTWDTSSDERKKKNWRAMKPEEAYDVIRKLPAQWFKWKADGQVDVGWSAQKSFAVHPRLASYNEEIDHWGIEKGARTPWLWAAVSGLMDRVDELEAKLAKLESK